MKKRVLVIDNSPGWTGAFKSMWTSTQLLSNEFDFTFCIPKGSSVRTVLAAHGSPFIELPFHELRKHISILLYFPRLIQNARRIAAYCKANGILVIHVNDLYNMTGVVAKMFHPEIALVHHIRLLPQSYVSLLYRTFIRIISSRSDALITVSEVSLRHISHVTKRKVNLIYDALIAKEWPQPLKRADKATVFLYPANYARGKGHDFAIRAFAEAASIAEGSSIFLRICGDDFSRPDNTAYKSELQERIHELKLDKQVALLGFQKDIEREILASDVVLNFSESESFSLVCLEALSLGRPLIATDSGGPAELFEDGISGILVPNRNIQKMKEAILRLAQSPELREAMGKAAKKFVEDKFDASVEASKLRLIYQGLRPVTKK